MISPEAAQSTLRVAEDGRLPELHLDSGAIGDKKPKRETTAVNPLVLFAVLALSVVMSVALALVDTQPEGTTIRQKKAAARIAIERNYFGQRNSVVPLEPYQVLLREAQRAHSRGDYKQERKLYRQILQMLRAEKAAMDDTTGRRWQLGGSAKGITGSRTRDRELEQHISLLLSSP